MKYLYELGKKIYYFLLEIVTFGKGVKVTINGIKLKLPSKYYRLFPPVYEKENFDFFNKHIKKGSVILDIGANIGLFSVIFSKLSQGKCPNLKLKIIQKVMMN